MRNWQTDEIFHYFTGSGLGTYRLQLGCCTERQTGFHRRNIRGCRTTLFNCFPAGFATVDLALRQYFFLYLLTGFRFEYNLLNEEIEKR